MCTNCNNTTDGTVGGLCSTCYLKKYGDLDIVRHDRRYMRRNSKKMKEYLDAGITAQQIIDLDLAIEVEMDLPKYEFRVVN